MAMNTLLDFEGLLVNNDIIGIDTVQVNFGKKIVIREICTCFRIFMSVLFRYHEIFVTENKTININY
jgi:hypothetical protein